MFSDGCLGLPRTFAMTGQVLPLDHSRNSKAGSVRVPGPLNNVRAARSADTAKEFCIERSFK